MPLDHWLPLTVRLLMAGYLAGLASAAAVYWWHGQPRRRSRRTRSPNLAFLSAGRGARVRPIQRKVLMTGPVKIMDERGVYPTALDAAIREQDAYYGRT